MGLDKFRDVDLVIDHANKTFIQKQFVSQNDSDGRTLTVQVTDNGVIGKVPGLTVNLHWHNESSGLTDLSPFYCIDRESSLFRIEYPKNMLNAGRVVASIQIIQNGKITHSKQFEINVQQLAGRTVGVIDKSEYGALVETLGDANKFRTDIDSLGIDKADLKYVDDLFANLAKGGPNGIFYSLSELESKYPSGAIGTYLVYDVSYSDGPHAFIWDTNIKNWKDLGVYQAKEIEDGAIRTNNIDDQAIATEMLPFVQNLSKNLFDINSNKILRGKLINIDSANNGPDKLYDQPNYNVTHPIYIRKNQSVFLKNIFHEGTVRYCQMVDANNRFIKYVDIFQSVENEMYDKFTAPVSAFYRFNIFSMPIKDFVVSLGSIVSTLDKSPIYMLNNVEMNSAQLSAGSIPIEMLHDVVINDYFEGSNFHTNLFISGTNELMYHSSDTVRITKPIYLQSGEYTTTYYPNLGSVGKCARVFPDGNIAKILESDGKMTSENITTFIIDTDGYYIFNHMGGILNGVSLDKFHIVKGSREDYLMSPMEKKVTIPRLKVENSGSVEGINYDIFEQAYIRNGKLVSNLEKKPNVNNTAFYTFADLQSNCNKMIAKARFKGRNGAALIATAQGKSKVQDILKKSVHIVFDFDHVNIQVIIDNVTTTIDQVNYEQPCDITGEILYTMGWELKGTKLIVSMPDGRNVEYDNILFQECNGQYVCWEHYTEKNWENRGDVQYEYFEANSSSDRLKDSFNRGDGAIGISESGHVYTQFSSIESNK